MEQDQNSTEQDSPSLLGVRGQGLTDREKWLMQRAWAAGWDAGTSGRRNYSMQAWLDDSAADGATVEMILETEAP